MTVSLRITEYIKKEILPLTFCAPNSIIIMEVLIMAKMGRPKSDNPSDHKVSVRLTKKEHDLLLQAAKSHNLTMAQLVKSRISDLIQ